MVWKISRFRLCSTFSKTSEIPKRPITRGTRPIPSFNSRMLNVNRRTPEVGSMPMIPKTTPKTAIISALGIEPEAR